ncbi:hypothetical protein ACTM9K_13600 [Bariatricus sp. HCP3S3_E12]|uniref:hypothetical protein n=1 Tax=Bariatricus sp. HCP3S3_E12 TaxID=3438906 RepID=UPI003F894C77
MVVYELTSQEKKKYIKQLLKGYRKMTKDIEVSLEAIGFQVEHTKNHVKLFYNGKLFSCPSTASDFRSGMNLATVICREILTK